MSFLAPLFLLGAAAIALPFVFHLIRRSSKEKVLFSSLMFLTPSPPRITKRSRLEHLLLLLLRCAAICAIALAFARPFFSRPSEAAGGGDPSSFVAILVDTSASMQRGNLWEEAVDRAVAASQELKPGDRVALFTFGNQLRTLLSFSDSANLPPSGVSSAIETRLAGINPSWEATAVGPALTTLTEIISDEVNRELNENVRARIVLVSDMQSGARLEGLQGFEWPNKISVDVKALPLEERSNGSVHILNSSEDLLGAGTNIIPRVRMQNAEGSTQDQFQIAWVKGNSPVTAAISVYVPPGESRIVVPPSPPQGAEAVFILQDSAPFDNTAWWVAQSNRPVVVSYYGGTNEVDPNQPLYYLKRAFEQENLAVKVSPLDQLLENETADLLITSRGLDAEGVEEVREMLALGKTVLVAVDRADSAQALAPILGVPVLAATEASVRNYALLGQIDFSHALLRPFADARFSDFTKIHIWKYRQLDLSGLTNATVPIRFDSGAPFLIEVPVEQGRMLILTTTWVPSDSQFALSTKFVPLLFRILEQSMGSEETTQQYLVGQTVRLPGDQAETEGTPVYTPGGGEGIIRDGKFTETIEPGIYRVGNPEQFRFAVNLDPSESRVNPISREDLSALGVPLETAVVGSGAATLAIEREQHRLSTELEAQQKLWRNVLLAGIALLFAETWLAGRLSRASTAA